ncbi:alpha/beta hydrolase [Motilimonas pumila]|uniref:Esterase n=1 Tax=Motilimonas pumila TaxID=2303987 RepID=A0A418Y9X5_9GAMM|nr:alpha/beta hydrolase-fold protein [Motilimonas pumila]RJG38298.1 hypothetical protein D1Z90_19105 [Motilimonas pumila]
MSDYTILDFSAPSLKGACLVESLQRQALVYLPPSYGKADKKYPVVYWLHGFGGLAKGWFSAQPDEPNFGRIMDSLLAQQRCQEMIIVVPDNSSVFTTCAYVNNSVQGHWLDMLAIDLVTAVEREYDCLPGPQHRAIAGHSSGADGVLNMLMHKPSLFQCGFAMSPANLHHEMMPFWQDLLTQHLSQLRLTAAGELATEQLDIWAHILLAKLQQACPAPQQPPLFCQLESQNQLLSAMASLSLDIVSPNYYESLKQTRIAIDMGTEEAKVMPYCLRLIAQWQSAGIKVNFTEFPGGHVDHIAKSLHYVLPWLSQQLDNAS